MTADTLVLPAASAEPAPLPHRGWFRQLGVDTGYTLVRFPLGIASFLVVVTGLCLGAGLLVVGIGVAVLAATLLAARGFAVAERAMIPPVLRRLFTPLRDPQTWLTACCTSTARAGVRPGSPRSSRARDPRRRHGLDPQVVAQLLARRRANDPVGTLTPREREVLGMIAEGHSNTAIARLLVITPGAVEKHTQHIFAKLGLAPDEDQHRRVPATLAYLRG